MLSITILYACSSLNSVNQVSSNKVILKGGKAKSLSWSDSIQFTRESWYSGATLKYDILNTKLAKDSPFANWIGKAERERFNSCQNYYVLLVYSQSSNDASKAEIMSNFDIVGLKRISIPIFESHFRNHPFNAYWKLQRYSLYGMCKTKDLSHVEVNIPNFSIVKVLE